MVKLFHIIILSHIILALYDMFMLKLGSGKGKALGCVNKMITNPLSYSPPCTGIHQSLHRNTLHIHENLHVKARTLFACVLKQDIRFPTVSVP